MRKFSILPIVLALLMFLFGADAFAHGVADDDKAFFEQSSGMHIIPFIYLGAKHMVTGYDHLLFLFGVIFFLYRLRDVGVYVTLFAMGHSMTLLFGVLSATHVNPFLVDAIIGFSVVYKALDNMGALERLIGFQPDPKKAVMLFGLFHGFGLAAKLQELKLSPEGLVPNIISFNVGVEIGQMLALSAILIAISYWRRSESFNRQAFSSNAVLMTAGFVLMGYQVTGYVTS
jgi:hypothetical protein